MKIGYARVSTGEQNLEPQIDDLKNANCDKIFQESVSSIKAERPELSNALSYVREGDTLVVWRFDRAARSVRDLSQLLDKLQKRSIDFISIKQNLDTRTPLGKFTFHIIAAFDELERDINVERTKAGLAAARARGRFGGRRHILNDEQLKKMMLLYKSNTMQVKDVCSFFKIGTSSFYDYKRLALKKGFI